MLRSLVGSEMCIRDRLYLSDEGVGGPTVVTNQRLAHRQVASHGCRISPRYNRLAMFDGELLHGVIPGSGTVAAPVSYTHLTLPTKRIVEISVVAGSLKKKRKKKRRNKMRKDKRRRKDSNRKLV
eukprot:TRINITY_DN65982_c0_g1_i1.p1 TRINITY_DN65982_c0_g1~~TRINITY_DN65982_c0_g1_i1.p1  ORF type:complete len:125 (+),score=22.57 TRINITY_DN65982_c0_g1_i1:125-499(+)